MPVVRFLRCLLTVEVSLVLDVETRVFCRSDVVDGVPLFRRFDTVLLTFHSACLLFMFGDLNFAADEHHLFVVNMKRRPSVGRGLQETRVGLDSIDVGDDVCCAAVRGSVSGSA